MSAKPDRFWIRTMGKILIVSSVCLIAGVLLRQLVDLLF